MAEYRTVPVEYIFLDVVRFTHGRSVEAQTDIVNTLNQIVKKSVEDNHVKDEARLFFPTGDGICIALINVNEPYDAAIKIALLILELNQIHNDAAENHQRIFHLRIGISRNKDNLVTDINGNTNLAGTGINTAQRIMNFADTGQILLSESAHDELKQREPYMALFRQYSGMTKHKEPITVYQLVKNIPYLNTSPPAVFVPKSEEIKKEAKLSLLAASYMACALSFPKWYGISTAEGDAISETYCTIAYYFYALDYVAQRAPVARSDRISRLPGREESTFEQNLNIIKQCNLAVCHELERFITQSELEPFASCFAISDQAPNFLQCSQEGKIRLKKDWPDIWKEFDLDNC